jgi:uncharacterized protein YecE (DUF72 family)
MDSVLIGTSGYDYPAWKGIFYPPELKRKEFLEYYATQFNALEINNTFYGIPDSSAAQNLFERTQGKVNFSVKANRALTHEIDSHWKERAAFGNKPTKIIEKKINFLLPYQIFP